LGAGQSLRSSFFEEEVSGVTKKEEIFGSSSAIRAEKDRVKEG